MVVLVVVILVVVVVEEERKNRQPPFLDGAYLTHSLQPCFLAFWRGTLGNPKRSHWCALSLAASEQAEEVRGKTTVFTSGLDSSSQNKQR